MAALLGHGIGPLGTTLAVGTVSSLVATMIVISHASSPPSARPRRSPPVDLGGSVGVKPKNAIASTEWLHVPQSAKQEFYIAGHSLGRWCSATNQEEFKDHLKRLLRKGGNVTLVILAPESPQIARLQKATSVHYRDRIRTSLAVLADLDASLNDGERRRLTISTLPTNSCSHTWLWATSDDCSTRPTWAAVT